VYLNPNQIPNLALPKLADLHIWRTPTHIEIDRLVVKKEWRNQGVGTETVRAITQWAKRRELKVYLTAEPLLGSTKTRLLKFYKRMGFAQNRDARVKQSMVWTDKPTKQ
jgi:GNAT superfamily N-acetyltransferase